MLEELHLRNRKLKDCEKLLLLNMLANAPSNIKDQLENAVVQDMSDGGMGSVIFVSFANESGRALGKTIAEAKYIDADNVEVLISVNLDNRGDLFEIDFWKTDFSPLIEYPKSEKLENLIK